MVCLNCGCQNEEGAVVCAVCGASLSSAGNMGVYPEAGSVNGVYQAGAGNTAVNTTAKEQPLAEMPENRHDVFISYSTKNKNVADAIVANFEQNGIRCWYAPRDIMPGQEWVSAIKEGLKAATVFVLIYTDESNQSRQVMNEVALAFNGGKTIVPFRLTESQMNDELEYYLTRVHWMDALSSDLSSNIDDLRRHVATILHKPDSSGAKSAGAQATGNVTAGSSAKTGSSGSGKKSSGDSGKKKWLIPAIVAAVAVAAVVGVIIALSGKKDKKPDKGGSDVVVSTEDGSTAENVTGNTEASTTVDVFSEEAIDKLMSDGMDALFSGYFGTEERETAAVYFTQAAEAGRADAHYYLGFIKGQEFDYNGKVDEYNKGIEAGSDLCRVGLAIMYYEGETDNYDLDEAKRLNDEAKKNGAIEAEYYEGIICQYGLYGNSINGGEAVDHYLKAAESKCSCISLKAYDNLGKIYRYGCNDIKPDYNKAIEYYQIGADAFQWNKGYFLASIGIIYNLQNDTEANKYFAKAIEFFESSSKAGYLSSYGNLGLSYQNGYGVEKNGAQAIANYTIAANAGYRNSMRALGRIYRYGYSGVAKSVDDAYYWYKMAADNGDKEAMDILGDMYLYGEYGARSDNGPDYREAQNWYEKAIDKGSADAMCSLGRMYYSGTGVNQDYNYALDLFRQAEAKGSAKGAFYLGLMSDNGFGVEQDVQLAFKYYVKSAEMGYARGMYFAAEDYREGYGVEQDYALAREWAMKAAENDEVDAMKMLAEMDKAGEGLEGNAPDLASAAEWYKRAAETGDLDALDEYVKVMEELDETKETLISSLDEMAENGSARASLKLAIIYFDNKEYDKAMDCFNTAIDGGDNNAMAYLGLAYCFGFENKPDHEKGFEWFDKAVATGDEAAIKIVKNSVSYLVNHEMISKEDAARWLDDETTEGTTGESSEEATEGSTEASTES